ncbi:sorting nexin-14-like isoform X2 [Cydia pomonella]|uniref:sorting nexin-14-like isoform X2 n=1 Tax=Cydia pomonella TaxID=82600 RepID=UPI002ADDF67C|nr:sorting nexin-14-like isoform X2 [Cydia pomonella]
MTERCQTKFTEKFENQNYVIYVGILVASLAVLYVYRFHFATIAVSYVLGCVACYYGLNSNVLDSLVNKIKCHSVVSNVEDEAEKSGETGCATCGLNSCPRHDSAASSEPWVGLHIHKQLDEAIEQFYNAILEQFIGSWYKRLSERWLFTDELRLQLRRASARLLRRALKVNYSRFLTERLIPCALRHYTLYAEAGAEPEAGAGAGRVAIHAAASSRAAELKYLRSVTDAIMPYLLNDDELHNAVFHVLVREIFAGWVLLSLTDLLADPYIINALIILATGDETMAQLKTTPDYRVEFLSTLARQSGSSHEERARLLHVDLELLVGEPRHLYAFMQHVKSTSQLQLLQFYKDIKLFQTKLLDPNLKPSEQEQATLFREAAELLARRGNTSVIHNGDLKRLQTCPEIFTAANEVQAMLENVLLPRFLHSEEYYKILIGSRIPTGYQKQNKRAAAVRARGPPRAPSSGLVLEHCGNEDADDGALLACLEHLADELDDDLVTYKVVLTSIDIRMQAPPRTGTVRVFTLCVYCVERGAEPRAWTVERSEHDFHLLRSKLLEFHGERLLQDLQLPSRRDNSPLETLRYKYEDFLQRALEAPLLQSSALLRLFLSCPDFALAAAAAALNGPDIGNMVTAVTHRLRKEKGQHLESFLRNYLLSADLERYQALKQGAGVEEAQEVSEDVNKRPRRRDIRESVFGNNFDVEPSGEIIDGSYQDKVKGFTQCLMYLLIKVVHARGWVAHVVGGAVAAVRRAVDDAFERWLTNTLARSLCERRLAHLIRLGHGE